MTKKTRKKDPYAKREAEKYARPIISREFIMEHLGQSDVPLTLKTLAGDFGITQDTDLEALSRRLGAMERDGQIIRNRRGGYGIVTKMDLVRGRVIGHPDGYGFLVPDDGGDDVFLSARQMRSVFHGDRVMVQIVGVDRRNRREGTLVEILERNTHEVVGRYYLESGVGFVVPDNKRICQEIIIPPENQGNARHGQIVVAQIIEQPSQRSQAVGNISEVLGDHMAPGMEMEIAVRNYELPHKWPTPVLDEAARFSASIPQDMIRDREDIRMLPLVTIDGEDSRDFDDAVYCEPRGNGWRLLVAIADVSSYVYPDSALDNEARTRGNSVYFPENVIPMLPEILSNHLCSLNPDVDRLCMVCELHITADGKIQQSRFFAGVMRSHARLTYNKVAAILVERDAALCREYEALRHHLENLYSLYHVFRVAREKRGAIDFETRETRIIFGAQRKIKKIVPVERNVAHKMIEEFMIAANIAAAELFLKHKLPMVYRVHQEPSADKLTDLRSFLSELGLKLGGGEQPQAKDFARLILSVHDRPDRHLIETVLLRSMKQAVYHQDNVGHFGLALPAYTHFTSPIRRYPDLLVHRGIRHILAGKPTKQFTYSPENMQVLGDHCSMTERRADEATRDAVDWLKCEYMMSRVGQEFPGIITTVTSFGLFVELDDIYVEGLVHVTALENDYYHFDPVKHRMVGERTGRVYRLADKINVKVMRVDLDERKIDFVLAEITGSKRKKKPTARNASSSKRPVTKKKTAMRRRKRAAK